MHGLWFAPPAPAGDHRCSVARLVEALGTAPAADALVGSARGVCARLPKHWRHAEVCARLRAEGAARSAAELRAFLLAELAEALGVEPARVGVERGLDELGVSSLATLRLSQRLRRFLGRDVPAFALQSNPSVAELVRTLGAPAAGGAAAGGGARGRVLCLHGFKTSAAVLRQQMAPAGALLERLGYELLVPDAPFKTTGAAQFAEGLDEDDAYGWWTYEDETHDSPPVGLDTSLARLRALGPVAGVLGFSQGGAVAAQLADDVGARWALLFSPVYVPRRPARCSCPTLLAFDRDDEVRGATARLVGELPRATLRQHEHGEGHRLPVAGAWWDAVAAWLDARHDDEDSAGAKKRRVE